jgi:signal transduction histidine kinase
MLLHDVTERYRRQSEQARARRLSSMATLTSGVAHEIKNPLNSLNIHAQMLAAEIRQAQADRRALETSTAERAVEVIMEETKRLAHIVEQFIQAARPGILQFENRDLRPLIQSLEKIFRPECERAGIELDVTLDPDLPSLFIDEQQLLQALRNLVRNAIEALSERIEQARQAGDDFAPRLEIQALIDGDYLSLSVGDNGPGISEDLLEHIFEPYFTTKFSGSGLGLMVVYRIVNEHHGALHVDTHPGQGTRFIISLPLHKRPLRLLGHQAVQAPTPLFKERGVSP